MHISSLALAEHPLRPYRRPALLVAALYLAYLPFSEYADIYFDAKAYWFYSVYFHHQGSFSLFNFHDSRRG